MGLSKKKFYMTLGGEGLFQLLFYLTVRKKRVLFQNLSLFLTKKERSQ
jgi:hypothetical protein